MHKTSIPSVNYHLLVPCNMSCKYCYATFEDVKGLPHLHKGGFLSESDSLKVVEALASLGFQKITFAGGEPLMCKWLSKLVKRAKELGLTTCIVSNGSLFTGKLWDAVGEHLDWLTLSIDSITFENQIKIGRVMKNRKVMNADDYLAIAEKAREKKVKLKLNTVINRYNWEEDMNEFVKIFAPKRWKLLQVLPVEGQNDKFYEQMKVSDSEFQAYLQRHESLKTNGIEIIPETNEAMIGSYAMVDPAGRFFDNVTGKYNYSDSILIVGAIQAYQQVTINAHTFFERGGQYEF